MQNACRYFLQTFGNQDFHQTRLQFDATLDAYRFTIRKRAKLALIVRLGFGVLIAKHRQADVKLTARIAQRIIAPVPVAVRIDCLEAQNRNRSSVNAAELCAGVFDGKRQLGSKLNQSIRDHAGILG